ncbi:hypothetical protein AAHA92_29080 [Salvia divinorum]|uniref:Uncharacterized protein n=1 Tax=Salvia divinorum TaxID=28513 RepID=A0ABD1FX62_SALDI
MKPILASKDFETIGISFPMLKSFTYHNCWIRPPDFLGHVDFGKTMLNLRHLRLCEHSMVNNGLEKIIDGCPNLKSLHRCLCSALINKELYAKEVLIK